MKSMFGRLAAFSPLVIGGLLAGGCGEDGPGLPGGLDDLAAQCGLTCNADAIVEGNASISGVASVDAFFGAVVNFEGRANLVASGIGSALGKIAASLELDPGASGAEIKAALQAKLDANLQGGLTIDYQAPKCEVSASASVEATAKCEGMVDPGEIKASCSGKCEADVSASASCSADATVVCKGTAPSLQCEGTCEGSCEVELTAAAACEGTCSGTCNGTCSLQNAQGECQGECDGTCEGTCEVSGSAAANCTGSCKGDCEYTPPSGECEANASASCEASASGSVECSGKCEGEVTPPSASVECEATASASAEMNAECTPPELNISYQLSASVSGDVNAKAEFEAWLTGFKGNFQGLVTALGQAEIIVNAGEGLAAAASGAVEGAVSAQASGDVDLKASIGLACALTNLPKAVTVVSDATANLSGKVTAAGEITSVFGG